MLPTAGLFLPETLHRREVSSCTEPDAARLKFFSRHTNRSKQDTRKSSETSSPTDRSSQDGVTDLYPSLTTAFGYADFVSTTNKITSESGVLGSLIHRVRADINEASRLYLSPAVNNFLDAWPDRRAWIDAILHDVRRTLNEIGAYIESLPLVVDIVRKRFEWVLNHPKKLATKQQFLTACHQSLMSAVTMMQTAELCSVTNGMIQDPIFEAPVLPWVKREDSRLMRGPYSRRESRLSQKNLTSSSSNLSHSEMENTETGSIDSVPIELPGSTPDDIADPDNLDLYAVSKKPASTNQTSSRRPSQVSSPDQTFAPSSRRSSAASGRSLHSRYSPFRPVTQGPRRQSLDQPAQSTSIPIERRANSIDAIRLRTNSEENQETVTTITEPVISTTPVNTLPAVAETSLERNESTTSSTTVVTIPRYARAHRPTSVYIRYPERHQSLPTVLPPLQNQPTLAEDLADWIGPNTQSEKLPSIEWDATSTVSSPQMSIMSGLVITEEPVQAIDSTDSTKKLSPSLSDISIPDFEQDSVSHLRNESVSSPRRSAELFFNIATQNVPARTVDKRDSQSSVTGPAERDRAHSIRSVSSSIARKPLPPSSVVSLSIMSSTSMPSPDQASVELSPKDNSLNAETRVDANPDSVSTISTTTIVETEVEASTKPRALPQVDPLNETEDQTAPSLDTTEISPVLDNLAEKRIGLNEPEASPTPAPTQSTIATAAEQSSPETQPAPRPASPSKHHTNPTTQEEIPMSDPQNLQESDPEQKPVLVDSVTPNAQTPEPKAASPTVTTNAIDLLSTTPPHNSDHPMPITPPTSPPIAPPKPLTAQAKRRAAHQRRMQIAFGSDV